MFFRKLNRVICGLVRQRGLTKNKRGRLDGFFFRARNIDLLARQNPIIHRRFATLRRAMGAEEGAAFAEEDDLRVAPGELPAAPQAAAGVVDGLPWPRAVEAAEGR